MACKYCGKEVLVPNHLNHCEFFKKEASEVRAQMVNPAPSPDKLPEFKKRLQNVINCVSMEKGSNTPDWILAEYLVDCLRAFDRSVNLREKYYDRNTPGYPPVGEKK